MLTIRKKSKNILSTLIIIGLISAVSTISIKLSFHIPQILLNQIGYEPLSPKEFFIQSDYLVSTGYFDILDGNGTEVLSQQPVKYEGKLWEKFYYSGNFSQLITEGNYTLLVVFGPFHLPVVDFNINHAVYNLALQRGYEFFYYQRSNCETQELVAGFPGHALDHMDDGIMIDGEWRDLYGGWFSAGDYAKHTYWGDHIFGAIYAMLSAYERSPEIYNSIDSYSTNGSLIRDGIPDILNEALWGIQYAEKLILPNGTVLGSLVGDMPFVAPQYDTDQIIGTADDRYLDRGHKYSEPYECMWLAASFAKFAFIINQTQFLGNLKNKMQSLAFNLYNNYSFAYNLNASLWYAQNAVPFLEASWNLNRISQNPSLHANATWAANASTQFLITLRNNDDDLGHHDRATGLIIEWALRENSTIALQIAQMLINARWTFVWGPLLLDQGNLFHLPKLFAPNAPGESIYFKEDGLGINSLYLYSIYALTAANNVLQGSNQRLIILRSNLIDWMFGKNPSQICMMEGLGTKNLPAYHHRYIYCDNNPRGAVPGAIPNGYTMRHQVPFVDLLDAGVGSAGIQGVSPGSNEPWLPHNVAFLHAFSL